MAGTAAVALVIGVVAYAGRQRAAEPSVPAPVHTDVVQAALAAGKPVVAEFGSVSCVSCREMKPILAELQRTHGEKLMVVDIDVLKERQYLARYRIDGVSSPPCWLSRASGGPCKASRA